MNTPQQPPGWYPDPQGPGQRYWDGVQWTEHRAPGQQKRNTGRNLLIAGLVTLGVLVVGVIGCAALVSTSTTSDEPQDEQSEIDTSAPDDKQIRKVAVAAASSSERSSCEELFTPTGLEEVFEKPGPAAKTACERATQGQRALPEVVEVPRVEVAGDRAEAEVKIGIGGNYFWSFRKVAGGWRVDGHGDKLDAGDRVENFLTEVRGRRDTLCTFLSNRYPHEPPLTPQNCGYRAIRSSKKGAALLPPDPNASVTAVRLRGRSADVELSDGTVVSLMRQNDQPADFVVDRVR